MKREDVSRVPCRWSEVGDAEGRPSVHRHGDAHGTYEYVCRTREGRAEEEAALGGGQGTSAAEMTP